MPEILSNIYSSASCSCSRQRRNDVNERRNIQRTAVKFLFSNLLDFNNADNNTVFLIGTLVYFATAREPWSPTLYFIIKPYKETDN